MQISWSVFWGSVQGIWSLGVAWLLTKAVDLVSGGFQESSFLTFCGLALVYFLSYTIIYSFSRMTEAKTMLAIRTWLKERVFTGMLWSSESSHRNTTSGTVMTKFQQQIDMLETSCYTPLFSLLKSSMVLVFSMGAMLLLQWRFAIICAVIMVPYVLLTRRLNQYLKRLQKDLMQASSDENAGLIHMVKGFYTARDYGREDYFLERYEESVRHYSDRFCQLNIGYNILSIIGNCFNPVVTLLLLAFGGLFLERGSFGLTVGGLFGLTQLASSMLSPATKLGEGINKIRSTQTLREGLNEYETEGLKNCQEWTGSGQPLPPLHSILLHKVSFAYGQKTILKDISMELEMGKKYAIVGPSGCGKSTLIKLILKQLEPNTGELCWNEIPYRNIRRGDLLCRVGCVFQSPMIFHKTVEENIAASTELRRDHLEDVMAQSYLQEIRTDMTPEEIGALPAQTLSGGEQKRVAYARALYRSRDILVLDEFTAALHPELADQLELELLTKPGPLVIHVTHTLKPERMAMYDGVFSLKNGTVHSCI